MRRGQVPSSTTSTEISTYSAVFGWCIRHVCRRHRRHGRQPDSDAQRADAFGRERLYRRHDDQRRDAGAELFITSPLTFLVKFDARGFTPAPVLRIEEAHGAGPLRRGERHLDPLDRCALREAHSKRRGGMIGLFAPQRYRVRR
jgi:hypothetical protein